MEPKVLITNLENALNSDQSLETKYFEIKYLEFQLTAALISNSKPELVHINLTKFLRHFFPRGLNDFESNYQNGILLFAIEILKIIIQKQNQLLEKINEFKIYQKYFINFNKNNSFLLDTDTYAALD